MDENNESKNPILENILRSGLGRISEEFMLGSYDKQVTVLVKDLGQCSGALVEVPLLKQEGPWESSV